MCAKKSCIWNPATCTCENDKHIGSIIDNSVFTCDDIVEKAKITSAKAVLTTCTSTNFYILLAFLLITIALLIAVSIYCYLIKYEAKQKPLLPCHYTISKLKETRY